MHIATTKCWLCCHLSFQVLTLKFDTVVRLMVILSLNNAQFCVRKTFASFNLVKHYMDKHRGFHKFRRLLYTLLKIYLRLHAK